MKHNKIYIMMLLVGSLALAGCSSEQDTEDMTGRTPITLGYTLQQAVVTRTTTTTINDAYIVAGGKVHVYITNHDDNTDVIYDNNFLVTNDTKDIGTPSASVMASVLAPMAGVPFYPEVGTVDISAYYPSSASSGSHTVMSDQTTDEGYAASDLMWATPVTDKGVSDNPVNLEFTHKMAKLIINVTKNTGINTISAIRLKNIAPTVTFDTSDGTTGAASGTPITISVAKGADVATGAAIIPAQTISGELIEVVTDGGTARFTVASQTFEANHCYTATIAVGPGDIGLTNTIVNWNDENFNAVNSYAPKSLGELTNLINAGGAYSDYLGMYVNADGTISSTNTSAVGIIAYMSTTDVDEDVPGSRILVLSLTDLTDVKFSESTTEMSGTSTVRSELCGFRNTNILRTKYGGSTVGMACFTYAASRPMLATRWFCPSYAQWTAIMGSEGIGEGTNNRTKSGLATNTSYWSSSGVNEGAASVLSSIGTLTSLSKNSARLGRACFAYPHKGIRLTASSIGWLVSSNGLAYTNMDEINAVGQPPLAMIALAAFDGKSNGEEAPYNHGLVMALTNDESTVWDSNSSTDLSLENRTNVAGVIADMSGISNTATIINSSTTSAAYVAQNHAPIISGCSVWFLPASGQWINVLNRWGANITSSSNGGNLGNLTTTEVNNTVVTTFNSVLNNAGGTVIADPSGFWTSTENSNQYAIRIYFDHSYGIGIGPYNPKNTIGYCVRAFCAF